MSAKVKPILILSTLSKLSADFTLESLHKSIHGLLNLLVRQGFVGISERK